MLFVSTRGDEQVGLDTALVGGIAPDGGLYMPVSLPVFEVGDFHGKDSMLEVAEMLLRPFFTGSRLRDDLPAILGETFNFPIPVSALQCDTGRVGLLELFHGPTAAFKDVGAGFLAACMTRLEGDEQNPLTILVATSGDTGGAVAAAFDQRPGMRVVVLYPEGRVSARQEHQLTCWGDNVLSLKVKGSFDECQALAKNAMADPALGERHRFSSANSINIGRLLPQTTYYADASLRHYRNTGTKPGFIVPTGNLGNALACIMARDMGLPIGPIVLATNANRTIPDFFETLEWVPRASVQTLASAMDVGDPSNMERLRSLVGEADVLRERLGVLSVFDEQIEDEIQRDFEEFGIAVCPHTATASFAWRRLDDDARAGGDWIVVATAHPAKFETIVEPLLGTAVILPESLSGILSRPSRSMSIEPGMDGLSAALEQAFG